MQENIAGARAEWREHWPLVMAAMMGLSFTAIAASSLGLLMAPLGREFGWGRTQISAGLTIYALVAVPLSPFVGALVDRWGARRLAIPGTILTAAAFALFGLASGSMAQWLGLWLVYSVVALAIKGTVWTAGVSNAFAHGRGLALALTLSGSAISMTAVPILTQWIVDSFGWRQAYFGLGLGWGFVVLALVFLFFFDGKEKSRRKRVQLLGAPVRAHDAPGLTLSEAFRRPAIIKLAVVTFLTILIVSAVAIHQVPILTESGVSRQTAAIIAAVAGGSSIAGKIATGWMMDRWSNRSIAGASIALPAVSLILLLQNAPPVPLIVLAIVLLGYGNGAFIQLSAYLTGRYGGLRNFGKIYGVMASLTALGLGLGPLLAGVIFDRFGSYDLLLACGVPITAASGLLVATLEPFPSWPSRRPSVQVA
jgi:MFS family permease